MKNNRILVIKFEDFVLNFNKNKRICKFLNVDKDILLKDTNLFSLEFSRSNIYKAKKFLSKNELKLIKKNLENIYNGKKGLIERVKYPFCGSKNLQSIYKKKINEI